MLYGSDRDDLRRAWADAWSKARAGQPLEPMERLLADVIAEHPEHHPALESPGVLESEFSPEAGRTNPFLHMGLHVAIREQLATDRPPGVRALYAKLLPRYADAHRVGARAHGVPRRDPVGRAARGDRPGRSALS